jgi:hypothetical protein
MAEQKSPKLQLRFQDIPELAETFADSVGHWHFDGSSLRIDFLVTRFDPAKSPDARTGRKVPVCRLALTSNGALELLNECRRIAAVLEKAGVIKVDKAGMSSVPSKEVN